MIINLAPQRPIPTLEGAPLTVVRAGDVLTINGDGFDFSALQEGDMIARGVIPCDRIDGPVTRTGGHVVLTLRIDCGPSSAPIPQPDPIIDPPDGPISLPTIGDSHVGA